MPSKQTLMRQLVEELRKDTAFDHMLVTRKGIEVDVGLINQFRLHSFIPNKWFDWEPRVDTSVMIIGQDWGPYSSLQKYVTAYETERLHVAFNYDKFLVQAFSSRTEKFIMSNLAIPLRDVFFTVAVLLTRRGTRFRGNANFDENKSFELSYPYLSRQIDIVQPKIILTLGGLAYKAVARKYNLNSNRSLATIVDQGPVAIGHVTVLPAYHPAAFVHPKIQKQVWEKLRTIAIL